MMSSSSSNSNTSPHRIFVRNLPPNTSEEMLRAYFTRIGSVVDVSIFLDPYGILLDLAMISFCDKWTSNFFIQQRFHNFFGFQIETVELLSTEIAIAMGQRFDARNGCNDLPLRNLHGISPLPQTQVPPGMSRDTIVVLNVQPIIRNEVLRNYFNHFGVVKNVVVTRKGKKKKTLQGFHGLVTFVFEKSVRDALLLDDEDDEANEETFHEILGVKVQAKRAWNRVRLD